MKNLKEPDVAEQIQHLTDTIEYICEKENLHYSTIISDIYYTLRNRCECKVCEVIYKTIPLHQEKTKG